MYKKQKRTDYKICEFCGASLDIGEKCDCRERKPCKAGKFVYVCKPEKTKGVIAV